MRLSLVCLARAMPGGAAAGRAGGGRRSGGAGGGGGSDPNRILDKGVWKRFKYCEHCKLVGGWSASASPVVFTPC